ncbi:hypothetical protein [Peterkaempfera sp. SMS 1(5)a]|uniref:hypothetical protein n=1 Tax=Peterkaempfera podocarpi TaxID=3232308 RepID=UPI0036708579
MDDAQFIVVGIAVLLVLVVLAVLASKALDRSYRARTAEWAAKHGWVYREGGGGPWCSQLDQGMKRGVKFQLEGTRRGRHVLVAHWWFTTRETEWVSGSGDEGWHWETRIKTHLRMVVVVRLPVPCPDMRVEERGRGSRLGRSLGLRDPAAIGHDAFDRAFRIRAANPTVGRRLLTRQLVAAHLARRVPLWSVRGFDLVSTWEGKVRADAILPRVEVLLDVADLLSL